MSGDNNRKGGEYRKLQENRRRIGSKYEQIAADKLEEAGYRIRERNFRCTFGEVDLIAEKDGYLVFVEVKYRSTVQYGVPQEAVDFRKQRRISDVASFYLYRNRLPGGQPVRFDVAAVSEQGVEIIENAFPYGGRYH